MEKRMKRAGELIREARIQRGLTQKQLVERTNLSLSFIKQIERGVTGISVETIHKISRALGIDAGELYALENFKRFEGIH